MVKASGGFRALLVALVATLSLGVLPAVASASTITGYPGPSAGPNIPPGPPVGPLNPGQSAESYACGFAPGSEVAVKVGTTLAQTLIADVNGCILIVINVFAGPTMTVSGGKPVQAKPDSSNVVWVYCTGVNNKREPTGIKFPVTVPPSNLQGFVVFQGMPRGYLASVTVMACPTTSVLTDGCVGGRQTTATSGRFAMSVPVAGSSTTYRLTAGALTAGGLPVQASATQVVVKSSGVTTKNITFPYVAPTLVGTVTLAKGPKDFSGALGVQICPQTATFAYGCVGGDYVSGATVIKGKSAYGASLLPGKWAIGAGYRTSANATPILGSPSKVSVVGSSAQTINLSVTYAAPTLNGFVTATGLSQVTNISILACPTKVAFAPGCAGGQQGSTVLSDGTFSLWLAAKTKYNVGAGFPLVNGGIYYGTPTEATTPIKGSVDDVEVVVDKKTSPVEFTVTVNGAPVGADIGVAVLACPVGYAKFNTGCVSAYINTNYGVSGDTLAVSLPQGDWDVAGGYVLRSDAKASSNVVWSDITPITVSGNQAQPVDLPVDYATPSITGTATVSNIAAGSGGKVLALACPGKAVVDGCTGGILVPISSGKYSISGLKNGPWAVAPVVLLGGVYDVGPATAVTVSAARTVTATLRSFAFTRPHITARVY